jgi:uncharacterized protein (TIGR03083 family)
MDGSDVRSAAEVCCDFLAAAVREDWRAGVPDLEWSVAEVVAHVAEGCLWYAIDLAAAGKDLEPVEQRVQPTSRPDDLVATVRAHAEVAASVVDAAPPHIRGFHPLGAADPDGFAAMACDELLVHTYDAARGLARAWSPPVALAEKTLRRLFPWAPGGGDPWETLLWANGRIALPGRDRLEGWRWHCAPLDEWDGR